MKVQSSTISEIDREVVNDELFLKVTFVNGREYLYQNVPSDVYESFLTSQSKGKFLNEHIVGRYNYTRIK
jgi:hypothetical protein